MINTIPMPLDAGLAEGRSTRPLVAEPPATHAMEIGFTGSGSEYFRIWIVNLLLTLATLGLYYPWAKVRRLRYFYGNTVVGGHPLDFHGSPRRMLRGYLLVGTLVLLYSLAGNISPNAGLIAFVIVAAVWPALFRASQQFRMANTSWRGLRLRFLGDLGGTYRAMLPLFVPGLLTLLMMVAADAPAEARSGAAAQAWAIIVGSTLLLPLLLWMLKKYQHDHYALAQVQTQLRSGAGSFYLLALKSLAVVFLAGMVAGVAAMAALIGGTAASGGLFDGAVLVGAVCGAIALVGLPYMTSRLQNLVWGCTRSRHLRFASALRFWPLFGLTLKNWLLIVVTLGLYWPFAKVAMARLRLEAVSVLTLLSPDEWVGKLRQRADDAAGDAAGDLFGIDIGL